MRQITRMPNGQHTFDSFQIPRLKASIGLLVIGKLGIHMCLLYIYGLLTFFSSHLPGTKQ